MGKKVALVTGASSGFGFGIAKLLLANDFIVYAAARRLEPMRPLEQAGARLLAMDICEDESVNTLVAQMLAEAGCIDVVVNNAGYGAYGAVEDVTLEEAQYQFQVNLFGLARVNRAVLPAMRKQRSGRIILTASLSSHIATPGTGWYGASKHALKALAEALRMELLGLGIEVIQIEPGPVKTGFEDVAFNKMDQAPVSRDYQIVIQNFRRYLAAGYARAPDMKTTLEAMLHAATAKRPKWVYRTTMEAKLVPVLRALLGTRLYAWVLLLLFKRAGAKAQ